MTFRLWLAGAVLGISMGMAGQECHAPLPPRLSSAENMFNGQQEAWLGEAVADSEEARWKIIHDPAMNAYVQGIADRLLAGVDTHGIKVKLKLVESADVNGWTIADGRVYLTRKMLIAAQNEDEIAGVMAHEFGHALTGQIPIDMSRRLRDTLRITALGDRENVFDTYNRFVENAGRQKIDFGKFEKQEREEQTVADQMAIGLLARAGYGQHSYADFWDRISEAQGKTGNGWTDFFGATKPEGKRLRLILQMAAALPTECKHETRAASVEFRAFHDAVTQFSFGSAERAALSRGAEQDAGIRALEPPLRSEVSYVRFSPDGKYVLAQDEASVTVLTREPFAVKEQIDAPDAYRAMFTPDSKQIVVYNRALRIEKWDLADKKLVQVRELVRPKHCWQVAVSPTGEHYACVMWEGTDGLSSQREDFFSIEVRDTATGQLVVSKKNVHQMGVWGLLLALDAVSKDREPWVMNVAFSPDGRYFLAAAGFDASAFDLQARSEVKLGGALREVAGLRFDWVGNDKIVGVDLNVKKSGLVQFPSGERLTQAEFASENVAGATKGDYALLGPTQQFTSVVFDLRQSKIIVAHNREGLDFYDGAVASDTATGDLELSEKGAKPVHAPLPISPLHRIQAATTSKDLRYLALSLKRSAGVYDLTTGKRLMHMRPFRGAYFDKEQLVADFPKASRMKDATHDLARVDLSMRPVTQQKVDDETTAIEQSGRLVLRWTHAQNKWRPLTLTVEDATNGQKLWTREFTKGWVPSFIVSETSGHVVMLSNANRMKDEIKSDTKLAQQLAELTKRSDRRQIYYIAVLDGMTGNRLAHMLCDTGELSFLVENAQADGDLLILTDTNERMLLYSLKDGSESAHFIGKYLAHSEAAGLIAMRKGTSQVHLIDAKTARDIFQRQFAAPVVFAAFNEDGSRMLVLTDDQKYRILKLTKRAAAQEIASK